MATAIGVAPLASAAEETACIPAEDAGLIYDPNEPPVCPTPPPTMLELVPSTVGRPPSYMAEFLARCAGMRDVIANLVPEVLDLPDFVNGDAFFAKAQAWRDRPPLSVIEKEREESRENWLKRIGPELNFGGSVFIHPMVACGDEFRSLADQE